MLYTDFLRKSGGVDYSKLPEIKKPVRLYSSKLGRAGSALSLPQRGRPYSVYFNLNAMRSATYGMLTKLNSKKFNSVKSAMPVFRNKNGKSVSPHPVQRAKTYFGGSIYSFVSNEQVVSHQRTARMSDVVFEVHKNVVQEIRKTGSKTPCCFVEGTYEGAVPKKTQQALIEEWFDWTHHDAMYSIDGWRQVYFNPKRNDTFMYLDEITNTYKPIYTAESVILISLPISVERVGKRGLPYLILAQNVNIGTYLETDTKITRRNPMKKRNAKLRLYKTGEKTDMGRDVYRKVGDKPSYSKTKGILLGQYFVGDGFYENVYKDDDGNWRTPRGILSGREQYLLDHNMPTGEMYSVDGPYKEGGNRKGRPRKSHSRSRGEVWRDGEPFAPIYDFEIVNSNPIYHSQSTERLGRPMGARGEAFDIVGNLGFQSAPYSKGGKNVSLYLYDLDDYDRRVYAHIPLKKGEKLYRFRTDRTYRAEPRSAILVKINVDKDLLYFMTEESADRDDPVFQTKGKKLKFLNLIQKEYKMNPRKRKSNALSVIELKQIRVGLVLARKAMSNHYKSMNAKGGSRFNYSRYPELWDPTTDEIINASFKGPTPVEKVFVEMLGVSRDTRFQKGEIKFNVDMSATVNAFGLVSQIKVRVEDPYDYTLLDEYSFDPYTGKKQKRKSNPRKRKNGRNLGYGGKNGQMLRNQLRTIERVSKQLHDTLTDSDQVPDWVLSKAVVAMDRLIVANEYIQSKLQGMTPNPRVNVNSAIKNAQKLLKDL